MSVGEDCLRGLILPHSPFWRNCKPRMHLEPGDIAACYGTGLLDRLIRLETGSLFGPPGLKLGPSHVAIMAATRSLNRNRKSQIVWCESTTLCSHPCLLREQRVSGVQVHRPEDRIRDYTADGARVEIYRLCEFDRLMAPEVKQLMRMVHYLSHHGVGYDYRGAVTSGTRVLKWRRSLASNLESLFCSEFIAAVLQRLGRMNRRNPTLYNPAALLRELVRTGVYRRVQVCRAAPDAPLRPALKIYEPCEAAA